MPLAEMKVASELPMAFSCAYLVLSLEFVQAHWEAMVLLLETVGSLISLVLLFLSSPCLS